MALSVASTVVLINALKSINSLSAKNGQIAVGWLIVEDLAMVLALVFLPLLSESIGGIRMHPQVKTYYLFSAKHYWKSVRSLLSCSFSDAG